MALSQLYSFTATVSTTEYSLANNSTTLATITTAGIFSAFIDLNALTATESYRFRIYEAARAAGTKRIVQEVIISGVQAEPIYVSPAMFLVNGWDFTLQKLQGTDRSIPWSIRSVA